MPIKQRILVIRGYVYCLWNSGRIVVAPLKKTKKVDKTQEELLKIINALKEYRESQPHKSTPRLGRWQWCARSNCPKAVYISPSYIHDGQACYCSNRCRSKIISVAMEYRGWVKDTNPKSIVYGRIGEIISVSNKGVVRVDFSEKCEFGKPMIRVYTPGFNLDYVKRVPGPRLESD